MRSQVNFFCEIGNWYQKLFSVGYKKETISLEYSEMDLFFLDLASPPPYL